MRRVGRALVGAATLVAGALPGVAHAQAHAHGIASPALDSLVATSARLTTRYADRAVATADGYRRVGVDFPGMGEHWVLPRALLAGAVDAAHPTLLIYADVRGRPTLLGVGFIVVDDGHAHLTDVPGWPTAWHEHNGLLAEESGARAEAGAPRHGTHVWVLHAWTRLPNADGTYAPDNWAVPFARLGLDPPRDVDADAGRALSLATGGDAYLRDVLTFAGIVGSRGAEVDTLLAMAATRVQRVIARTTSAGAVRDDDVAALRTEWRDLAAALRALLGAPVGPYLAPPHAVHATSAP